MGITEVITGTVKDAVALSQNIAKVVKEEVSLYLDNQHDAYEYDGSAVEYSKKIKAYFDEFETKAKDLVSNAFSGFKTSQSEEQEDLEARISALEEKLTKLVEESLEALRNEDAGRI